MTFYPVKDIRLDSWKRYEKVLYIPSTRVQRDNSATFGVGHLGRLFDLDLRPVTEYYDESDYQGYLRLLKIKDIDLSSLPIYSNTDPLLYIGTQHLHFGHFLIESLSRWWMIMFGQDKFSKFLIHESNWPIDLRLGAVESIKDISKSLNYSALGEIINAMGITTDQMVSYRQPCIICNVVVPEQSITLMQPSVEFSSHLYFDSMVELGKRICYLPPDSENIDVRPLYLSRIKLNNVPPTEMLYEQELMNNLAPFVDFMYPETMTVKDQLLALYTRKYIIGKIGSALHVPLMLHSKKTFSVLVDREVNHRALSYFKEFDRMRHYTTTYYNVATNKDKLSAVKETASILLANLY